MIDPALAMVIDIKHIGEQGNGLVSALQEPLDSLKPHLIHINYAE